MKKCSKQWNLLEIRGRIVIGMGAAPDWRKPVRGGLREINKEVFSVMEEIRNEAAEVKEETAAVEEVKAEKIGTTETMEDYSKELEASFRTIKEGDIISGTVIDVNECFQKWL